MSHPIQVVAYSGYQGEQEPRALVVGGHRHEVVEIDDRWLEPDARYFKVRVADGGRYVLRCALDGLNWSVGSLTDS
ncbi:MAG: hypothetical protein GY856_54925 [bacterium]|nr:hypothetical protein [bacterium]